MGLFLRPQDWISWRNNEGERMDVGEAGRGNETPPARSKRMLGTAAVIGEICLVHTLARIPSRFPLFYPIVHAHCPGDSSFSGVELEDGNGGPFPPMESVLEL